MPGLNDEQLASALIRTGVISALDLQQAREQQTGNGTNLIQILLGSGMISADDIEQATEYLLASQPDVVDDDNGAFEHSAAEENAAMSYSFDDEADDRPKRRRPRNGKASIEDYEVDPEAIRDIPRSVAEQYRLLPLQMSQDRMLVAMADATNVFAMDAVRERTGKRVEPIEVDEGELMRAIEQYYSTRARSQVMVADTQDLSAQLGGRSLDGVDDSLSDMLDQAPVIRIVAEILKDAVRMSASDVHIEPRGDGVVVRYRIDGQLTTATELSMEMHRYVLSRIKILAGEDIAETRKPQDGRFATIVDDRPIDLRVSTLPTYWGEKAVLRILDKSRTLVSLNQLGFRPDTQQAFDKLLGRKQGMLLVTGPTGSGKTTTLYASLHKLNDDTKNITTVEDPVEYEVRGLNQVKVTPMVDLTFATALRSILRQDPDVILVGEIRDDETAQMAFRASLTGHLVLSTLHTNDAPSAVARLVNIGIPAYIAASSLIGVLAQRLVRRLCKRCREACEPTAVELDSLQMTKEQAAKLQFHRARGCQYCRNTGYSGRIALYELMEMTPEVRQAIVDGLDAASLRRIAIKNGMRTLKYDGLAKIHKGLTSAAEVASVMFGDE